MKSRRRRLVITNVFSEFFLVPFSIFPLQRQLVSSQIFLSRKVLQFHFIDSFFQHFFDISFASTHFNKISHQIYLHFALSLSRNQAGLTSERLQLIETRSTLTANCQTIFFFLSSLCVLFSSLFSFCRISALFAWKNKYRTWIENFWACISSSFLYS